MKIKQLTLLIMAIGLSGVAAARNSTPPAAELAPQPKWFIGGDAIYGETGHDNAIFASGPNTASVQTQFVADRNDEWGFKVWAGYDAGKGASYWVDWFRFHNDGKTSTTPTVFASFLPPTFVSAVSRSQLTGKQESDVDQVTVQIGHEFKSLNGSNIKVHAGAQALLLEATNVYTGTAAGAGNLSAFNAAEKSDFDGGGVVVGVDLEHMCGNSFSIFSRNQVGLVYGRLGSNFNSFNDGTGATLASMSTENRYTILPTLNAELGAAYTVQLASMDLRIQAGVRGTVVVDGVQNYTSTTTDDRYNWTEASIFFGGQVAFSNLGGLFSS